VARTNLQHARLATTALTRSIALTSLATTMTGLSAIAWLAIHSGWTDLQPSCNLATVICSVDRSALVVSTVLYALLASSIPTIVGVAGFFFSRARSQASFVIVVTASLIWVALCYYSVAFGGFWLLPSAALSLLNTGLSIVIVVRSRVPE
jgi:hypothetical protein